MNVMVYNKYKAVLTGLNIEVMKAIEGVYNVDEIIDAFNFYYDKMIIDITAIRDYQNFDNLQKLAMNINMENVIFLLEDTPEMNNKEYLSKLVSLGIYNFTKDAAGINYLLVHPHGYREAININNLNDVIPAVAPQMSQPQMQPMNNYQMNNTVDYGMGNTVNENQNVVQEENRGKVNNLKRRIIGFKDVTKHAGASTLIYLLKKAIEGKRSVSAIEINRVDFLYFNDENMISTTAVDVLKEIVKRSSDDIVFIDLNDYEDTDICTEVYYLLEPSTIMLNRLFKRNKGTLEKLRNEKVILNRCTLSNQDIATFEFETKLNIYFALPDVDDRQKNLEPINKLASKMKL